MKTTLVQKSAITLTELLITSMLIGIAIVGLISVDTAIRRTQNVAALRGNNITILSSALLLMQRESGTARGFGTVSIPSGGSFPNMQTNPVGFIFDASGTISGNPAYLGFCFRLLSGTSGDYFTADMICYHSAGGAATGIIRRTYPLAWGPPTAVTNICDRCSFVIQEIPGGGLPLSYLNVEIERLADPSQTESDLINPKFWLRTSFSFDKVAR